MCFPFRSQNGANVVKKLLRHRDRKQTLFWDGFEVSWVSRMDGPSLHFPSQMLCFPTSERFLAFWTGNRFGYDFGVRWGRCWHRFGLILRSKSEKMDAENHTEFWCVFLSIWGPFWSPKTTTFSLQRPPFFVPNSVSDPVWAILAPSGPSCTDVGTILVVLGCLFGDSGLMFGVLLGSCGRFGVRMFDPASGSKAEPTTNPAQATT